MGGRRRRVCTEVDVENDGVLRGTWAARRRAGGASTRRPRPPRALLHGTAPGPRARPLQSWGPAPAWDLAPPAAPAASAQEGRAARGEARDAACSP